MTPDEIVADYPYPEPEDIGACIRFVARQEG